MKMDDKTKKVLTMQAEIIAGRHCLPTSWAYSPAPSRSFGYADDFA
jgi:hypothetical protein